MKLPLVRQLIGDRPSHVDVGVAGLHQRDLEVPAVPATQVRDQVVAVGEDEPEDQVGDDHLDELEV